MEFDKNTVEAFLKAVRASGQPVPEVIFTPPIESLHGTEADQLMRELERVRTEGVVVVFPDSVQQVGTSVLRAIDSFEGEAVLFNTPPRVVDALKSTGFGYLRRVADRENTVKKS